MVRAMAEGALERTGANVAIAVSGIAGPAGAVPGKPVGTVWFALAQKLADRLECQGHLIQFDGDRDAVRRQSVEYALNLLRALPTTTANTGASPSGMLRLFFALQPAAEQSAALAEQVAPLISRCLKAQRVPPENFHATLCFIGAVAPKNSTHCCRAVAGVRGKRGHAATSMHSSTGAKPGVMCATAADNAAVSAGACAGTSVSRRATIAAGFHSGRQTVPRAPDTGAKSSAPRTP